MRSLHNTRPQPGEAKTATLNDGSAGLPAGSFTALLRSNTFKGTKVFPERGHPGRSGIENERAFELRAIHRIMAAAARMAALRFDCGDSVQTAGTVMRVVAEEWSGECFWQFHRRWIACLNSSRRIRTEELACCMKDSV